MKEEARGGEAHHTKRRLHETAVPQNIEGTHPSLSQQPPPSPRTCNMGSWLTSLSSTWTHITQAPDHFLAISFRLLIVGQGLDEKDSMERKTQSFKALTLHWDQSLLGTCPGLLSSKALNYIILWRNEVYSTSQNG